MEKNEKSKKNKKQNLKKEKKEKTEKEEKKSFKVEIRKLPTNNFTEEQFKESLKNVLNLLNIKEEDVLFLHYMNGKIR